MVDGGNRAFGAHRHDWPKITGGFAIHQIAPTVTLFGLDQGDIAMNWVFQDIVFAIDAACFFGTAICMECHGCAITCWGKKCAHSGTGGPNPLSQITLWHQLQFNFSAPIKRIEHMRVRLTWKAANDFSHATCLEQRCQTSVAIAGVVVDHS